MMQRREKKFSLSTWSVERKITLGFGLALLTLLLISVTTYRTAITFMRTVRQGTQIQQLLIELDDAPLQLARAEAAQRNYMLTGEQRFLALYQNAVQATQKELADLHAFVIPSSAQGRRLEKFGALITEKLAGLQRVMTVQESQGAEAAMRALLLESDQQATGAIQALMQEIEQEAQRSWRKHSARVEERALLTSRGILSGGLLTLILLTVAGLRIRHDLVEQRRMEEELRQSRDALEQRVQERTKELAAANEALHTLSRQLLEAQEQERRRIARELHDELGQGLTSVKFGLQMLEDTPRMVQEQLPECIAMVDVMLQQVRNLSLNLRPSLLDDLGLIPALDWYVKRQGEQLGVVVRLNAPPLESRPHPVVETACFRVVQEAFTNIARHAQARHVWVDVRQDDGRLSIVVRDDGVGFDVLAARRRAAQGGSLGVLGMEERIALVGGRLELRSAPGQGTEVDISVPLGAEPDAAAPPAGSQPLPAAVESGTVRGA
ncbi:MAG TPA: CHASE3 domain-containing protein [Methylomirabilota bacterium]|jgi:signal transduction histidine kinase|nr:CHASE3 domain-containing protein [Methylomirabilota bacterium]